MRKTVILENEYEVDERVEALLEDFPQLFEKEPTKLIGIKQSSFKTLSNYIEKDCCVLFSSTFLYKDQLEEYMEKFATLPFKVTFYVHDILTHIEEWLTSSSWYWQDRASYLKNLERVLKRHTIYTFQTDFESEMIENKHYSISFPSEKRHKYKVGKVEFDHEKKKANVNVWIKAK